MGKPISADEFIAKARNVHGARYDYSKVKYSNTITKVTIICEVHGDFLQTPNRHLYSNGCIKCTHAKFSNAYRMSSEEFEKKARERHGKAYDYKLINYINNNVKISIICKKHGRYEQLPRSHLCGQGCPQCALKTMKTSKGEAQLAEFVAEHTTVERNKYFSKNNKRYELDIYCPNDGVGIEYDGIYWHSEEQGRGRHYHKDKDSFFEREFGIGIVHIRENEWRDKREVVKSLIKRRINVLPKRKLRTACWETQPLEAKEFLTENHLLGVTHIHGVNIGLYHAETGELISLATFSRCFPGKSEWTLEKFSEKLDTATDGALNKIISYFIKMFKPISVVVRVECKHENSEVYDRAGFVFLAHHPPDYSYHDNRGSLYNRHEKLENDKYGKIWDCGKLALIWKKTP